MSSTDKRNGFVDLIKFVMAIGIMLGHYSYIISQEFESVHIDRFILSVAHKSLAMSVCIFFVFSGFYGYKGFKKLHAIGVDGAGDFISTKVNRLYPLMILSIVFFCLSDMLYVLVRGHYWAGRSLDMQNIILSVLGINRWICEENAINGPIWYVDVLMLCFVILCLFSVLKVRVEYKYMMLGFMVILGLISQLYSEITFPLIAGKVGRGYMCFFTGVLTAAVFEKWPKIVSLRNIIISGGLFILLCAFGYKTGNDVIGDKNIVSALFLAPMLIAIGMQKKVMAFCNNAVSSWLGTVSYGIFLFHIPTFMVVALVFYDRIDYNSWIVICSVIMIVTVLSAILSKATGKVEIIKKPLVIVDDGSC